MSSPNFLTTQRAEIMIKIEEFVLEDLRRKRIGITQRPDGEAIQLVLNEYFDFCSTQNEPPFAILEMLDSRIEQSDFLGRPVTGPRLLQKISSELIVSGVRQNVVEGEQVRWVRGSEAMTREIETRASGCVEDGKNLFRQAYSILDEHVFSTVPPRRKLYHHNPEFSLAEALKKRARLDQENQKGGELLSKPWQDYSNRIEDLRYRLNMLTNNAIRDGRILVAEAQIAGASMSSPENASEQFMIDDNNTFVCFTADLPPTWFDEPETLEFRKKRAKRKLESVVSKLNKLEKRASEVEHSVFLKKLFGLTDNAAKSVFQEVRKQAGGLGGNFNNNMRISQKELKAIYAEK